MKRYKARSRPSKRVSSPHKNPYNCGSNEFTHQFEEEDNRVCDEINKGKTSSAPLHTEYMVLSRTKKALFEAEEKGLVIKSGQFTKEEDSILTKNWHQFCDDFPVDNPYLVLGFYRYNKDKDKDEIQSAKNLIKKSEMYLRLAKGLPHRPISSVYQRARKLFSGLKKAKHLTDDNRQQIIELSQKGYKSAEIASHFFADIKAVDDVVRRNVNPNNQRVFKKNEWTKEDDTKLNKIIVDLIVKNEITDHQEIPWTEVSILMGNRNSIQCREHFYRTSFWKIFDPNGVHKKWNSSNTQKLVYFIYKQNYKNEADMDWDEIKEKFEEYYSITKNWYRLKTRYEDYTSITFSELMERLYNKYIKGKDNIHELEEFVRFGVIL